MAKYYVTTGDVQTVIIAKDETEAAVKALGAYVEKCDLVGADVEFGTLVKVGQRGFRQHQDDRYISTEVILNAIDKAINENPENTESAGNPDG